MWAAQEAKDTLTDLELPAQRIIIAHTAIEGQANTTSHVECMSVVNGIQNGHMVEWVDIRYNFLVGGDGCVYEGLGWNKQGDHTVKVVGGRKVSYNEGSICIAFIGTFCEVAPPEKQLMAAQALINQGVQLKKLKSDYKLYGHVQLKPTKSPGQALYDIIRTWRGWTNEKPW